MKTIMAILALLSVPAAPYDYVVTIDELNYHPDNLQIRVGDRVTWKNFDADEHSVTAEIRVDTPDGQDPIFDSDRIPSGGSFSYTFVREGSFRYFCKLHDGPTGVVIVRPVR